MIERGDREKRVQPHPFPLLLLRVPWHPLWHPFGATNLLLLHPAALVTPLSPELYHNVAAPDCLDMAGVLARCQRHLALISSKLRFSDEPVSVFLHGGLHGPM